MEIFSVFNLVRPFEDTSSSDEIVVYLISGIIWAIVYAAVGFCIDYLLADKKDRS